MTILLANPIWSAALGLLLKASAVLALAALADVLLRRRASAATRHLVWTLAVAALVMLPAASLVAPDWPIAVRTRPPVDSAPAAAVAISSIGGTVQPETPSSVGTPFPRREPAATPTRDGIAWTGLAASLYLAGVAAVLALLVIQRWSLRRFARTAEPLRDSEWTHLLVECAGLVGVSRPVRLLRSVQRQVPMTFGTASPSIVVPAEGDLWSDERRRAVLLHELAHVARLDCLTQTLAMVACAMYWLHPAVWWAARRLRVERELACDDRVIAAGTEPREYAGHLLEIAYALGARRAPALAVPMARRQQLEGRLLAAVDAARNRRVPPFRLRVAVTAVAVVVLTGLAAVRLTTVVASADEERAAGVTIAAERAPKQDHQVGPALKRIDRPISPLVRRLRDVAAVFGIPQRQQSGTWELRPTDDDARVHLRIVEPRSSWGSDVPLARLEGLTRAQLQGAGGPVQFRIRRDAGTLTFDGVLKNGVGAGTFSFTPDPNFPAELARRGFARPTPDEQYDLARADVGYAFLDELNAQGYRKPDTSELVRAGQHGVGTDYLREMGAIGYKVGVLSDLITLRDHGVTPRYAQQLADLGYKNLPVDAIRNARDHGVTPEFIKGLRDAGYTSLSLDETIKARDHGVTPEYVKRLRDAGYRSGAIEDVIRMRDHGVSADYVEGMRQLGQGASIDDLRNARDHGVSTDYVKGMREAGYGSASLDDLVKARDHGVTVEYARDLKTLGYDGLSLDDLVTLRDHGVTIERIRSANARAGTKLPIDMLRALASSGWR